MSEWRKPSRSVRSQPVSVYTKGKGEKPKTYQPGGRGEKHDHHCDCHCYATHNPTAPPRISIQEHVKMSAGIDEVYDVSYWSNFRPRATVKSICVCTIQAFAKRS